MTHLYDGIFQNSEPFAMNIVKFLNNMYEFCRFEDASSVLISSVMGKFWKSYSSARIKVKNKLICRGFQMKELTHERHVQYHLTIK